MNMPDTMHVFHCMAKMVTGGNKLYMGHLCPTRNKKLYLMLVHM